MKNKLLPFVFSFWLTAFLLTGLSVWSSQAYGQRSYPNEVLETKKKKKKERKRRLKARRKADYDRGTKVKEGTEAMMELPQPGDRSKKLPKMDKHFQDELNRSKKNMRVKLKKEKKQKKIFQGNIKINKEEIPRPGTSYHKRNELTSKGRREIQGTDYQGNIKINKEEIPRPGTHYTERNKLVSRGRRQIQGTDYQGEIKVKRSEIKPAGTLHSERKEAVGKKYSSYEPGRHPGNKRIKKKYVKKPGTYHSERDPALQKQYRSPEAGTFEGNIRTLSKKQKARYYEKQSEKVHQYEGAIKLKFNHKNMHPSVAARKAVRMRSQEQVNRSRKFHLWWNRLWNREQPEVVKEKAGKPRYDKEENEIWDKSRDW